jgi:hypothetical protein
MNTFQEYLNLGISVIPCRDKICILPSWKPYQDKIADQATAALWSGVNFPQIACICGKVSGGLICIDFDVKNGNKYDEWLLFVSQERPEILSKLVVEKTPSGGYHVIFRSPKVIKNLKLAMNTDNQATIETRGEGGYFVCCPSSGYEWEYGNIRLIQAVTSEETEVLLSIAAALNEKIEPPKEIEIKNDLSGGLTPFDDFNSRSNIVEILQKHDWKVKYERLEKVYFQRPGKDGAGISASWNHVPDRFYCFTTSTKFENNHIYKASAVYAILEHNGDYNAAARALSAQGFGNRVKLEHKPLAETAKAILIDNKQMRDKLYDIRDRGYVRGESTGWQNLDPFYTVMKGQFTVVTGMPSSGKSQFVDAMMINLANSKKWKFAVFSPENYPAEMHYHQLVEKHSGKRLFDLKNDELDESIKFISNHFYFIDAVEDEINLEMILDKTEQLKTEKNIDGLIIDPWNEIELNKPKEINDTEFIGICLRKCRKFARRNNIHLWIVCHPTKMQKDKDGNYPIVELYDCAGSAHWRNKADNGICVHRDMASNAVAILIQKIKYRYTGKTGEAHFVFNQFCGRYEPVSSDEKELEAWQK